MRMFKKQQLRCKIAKLCVLYKISEKSNKSNENIECYLYLALREDCNKDISFIFDYNFKQFLILI